MIMLHTKVLKTTLCEVEKWTHASIIWRYGRRIVVWLLIQVLMATAIMLPFNQTANATSSWSKPAPIQDTNADTNPYAWHNWSANSSHWTAYPAIGVMAQPVLVPQDNFQLFGSGTFTPGATGGVGVSAEMINGDKWITLGQESVGTEGLSNQQISSSMQKFPKNSAYIFAQFSPENATGRIVIQKLEKMPNGVIDVYQADFTPWSGELWKAQGKYRTDTEIGAGDAGYNPFANFAGATTDPLFHNISWEAMKVAVGHAMRRYGVAFAFVAVDQPSTTQNTTTNSSLFSDTVTTTINGYAKPVWYVATPMEATASGETGQICVTGGTGSTTTSCDDPAHVAIAGVMLSSWSGGNMPQNQDLMYQWVNSQTNWNVLFFTVILMVVTFGIADILAPELLAVDSAAGAGSVYSLASTVFGSGGSLLQTQKGFFGATGNGWVPQLTATSIVQQGLMDSVNANHVTPLIGNGGMTGTDNLYKGSCGAGFTVQQCRQMGLDPGTVWRPDSYAEYNSTKAMRQRYDTCSAPVAQGGLGYSGTQAEKCAAPALQVIN